MGRQARVLGRSPGPFVIPAEGDPGHPSSRARSGSGTNNIRRPFGDCAPEFIEEILPFRIHSFDQTQLPRPVPFLRLLLALDRVLHRRVHVVVDETMDSIALREARNQILFVYGNPAEKVTRDTDMQRSITATARMQTQGSSSDLRSIPPRRRNLASRLRGNDVGIWI